ncbi:hypothetical protein ATANTOWER_003021 [Ataeniobius toweri]|uniref:Galaxin-like repeats domain-containing protein n=1 Tax=Ataeniobius toweri TaxID=208326 RepID=A0ABU7AXY1_9TELE|nr:hypothetical protein [Ataeniobius toweri]
MQEQQYKNVEERSVLERFVEVTQRGEEATSLRLKLSDIRANMQAHRLAYLIHIFIFVIFYKSVSGANDNASSNRKTCNGKLYNPKKDTCCRGHRENITEGLSEKVSKCCGLEAYLPLNEICCNFIVQPKPSPMAECCGKEAFDKEKQLCCGLNKKILTKKSLDHQCCIEDQYNIETQCCCPSEKVHVYPKNSECCVKNPPNTDSPAPADLRSKPKLHFCGSTPYNPMKQHCCQRKHGHPKLSYPSDASPTLYDPKKNICCDGRLTRLKPWMDRCCGDTPYGLAQRGVLCCKNVLYKDREDEEECSESGVPYKPLKETVCVSKRHNSPGGHCCGQDLYHPNKTICCIGHR